MLTRSTRLSLMLGVCLGTRTRARLWAFELRGQDCLLFLSLTEAIAPRQSLGEARARKSLLTKEQPAVPETAAEAGSSSPRSFKEQPLSPPP